MRHHVFEGHRPFCVLGWSEGGGEEECEQDGSAHEFFPMAEVRAFPGLRRETQGTQRMSARRRSVQLLASFSLIAMDSDCGGVGFMRCQPCRDKSASWMGHLCLPDVRSRNHIWIGNNPDKISEILKRHFPPQF